MAGSFQRLFGPVWSMFSNVCTRSYFWLLQLQLRGGLTGVFSAAASQQVGNCMKSSAFGSNLIASHEGEVFVDPWLDRVENLIKMITKSGKSWEIYSKLHVTMEWMTGNWHILLKIYSTAYSCKFQGIAKVPRLAGSQSDVDCLVAGIHWPEQQLKYHVW